MPTINDAIKELKRFREIVCHDIDCDGLTKHVDDILSDLKSIEWVTGEELFNFSIDDNYEVTLYNFNQIADRINKRLFGE